MDPYLDIVLRSLAVYLFMIIAIRITGKKQLSQLNTTDVVLILLISNAVQNAMVGPDTSLTGGIIAAGVLFLANFILKRVMYQSPKVTAFINQHPEVLVTNGVVDRIKMKQLNISDQELEEALREHGVVSIAEVRLCTFEVDGNISVITGEAQLRQTHYRRKRSRKSLRSQ